MDCAATLPSSLDTEPSRPYPGAMSFEWSSVLTHLGAVVASGGGVWALLRREVRKDRIVEAKIPKVVADGEVDTTRKMQTVLAEGLNILNKQMSDMREHYDRELGSRDSRIVALELRVAELGKERDAIRTEADQAREDNAKLARDLAHTQRELVDAKQTITVVTTERDALRVALRELKRDSEPPQKP